MAANDLERNILDLYAQVRKFYGSSRKLPGLSDLIEQIGRATSKRAQGAQRLAAIVSGQLTRGGRDAGNAAWEKALKTNVRSGMSHDVWSAQNAKNLLERQGALPGTPATNFGSLAGYNRKNVERAEGLISDWGVARGIERNPVYLPGGHDLSWPESMQGRRELSEAYGWRKFMNEQGVPSFVLDPSHGEGRAFGRYRIPRNVARTSRDPGLIALSQTSFQYAPQRVGTASEIADIYPPSTKILRHEAVDQLTEQITRGARVGKTSMVFDLETASLRPQHGIRQLSARFYDVGGKQTSHINLFFENSFMDLGHYGTETFDDFLQKSEGGAKVIERSQFANSLKDFYLKAAETDTIIGHNALFDVGMLQSIRANPLYKNDPEFKGAVEKFFAKTQTADFVDTAAHSRWIAGEITLAPELAAINKGTEHSMENILLQSSFLEDLMASGVSKAEIEAQLPKMHSADIDTFFTGHLQQMQQRAYAGEDVLRSVALGDKSWRHMITSSGAITPFTGLHPDALQALIKKGVIDLDDIGRVKGGAITPLDQMALLSRRIGMTANTAASHESLIGHSGMWSRYARSRKLLSQKGLGRKAAFPSLAEFGTFQERLAKAGVPFAGLSMVERMISTMVGEAPSGSAAMRQMRSALGEVATVGQFAGAKQVQIFGRGNVAMPLELLHQIQKGVSTGGKKIFQPTIESALAGNAIQNLGLSPFQTPGGVKDVAVNLGLINALPGGEDAARTQAKGVVEYLRRRAAQEPEFAKKYIHPKLDFDSLEEALVSSRATGVQVGTLAGVKPNAHVARLWDLLDELNYTADRTRPHLMTPLMAVPEGLAAMGESTVFTGPVFNSAGRGLQQESGAIRSELTRLRKVYGGFAAIKDDSRMLGLLERSKGLPDSGLAEKMVKFTGKYVSPVLKHPRISLGVAGAALASYYLYRHRKSSQEWDQTLATQGLEGDNFYDDYKHDLGEEPVPYTLGQGPKKNPLMTAGVVRGLDRNKVGHTQMGNRNQHLYGG